MSPDSPLGKRSTRRRQVCAAIVFLFAIAAGGCASMAAHKAADFEPGNVSAEALAKDADSCDRQAEAHTKRYGMGPYDPTHGSYNFMYDSCMQAGGYQRKRP